MDTILPWIRSELFDVIGVAGFALYVINYGLLTIGKLQSEQITYFVLNWLAASFVLVGLMASFNLASALIQIFWILISTIGIYLRIRAQRQGRFQSIRARGFTPS